MKISNLPNKNKKLRKQINNIKRTITKLNKKIANLKPKSKIKNNYFIII